MARTNQFIAEYAEQFKTVVDFDAVKPPVVTMRRFIRFLKPIDDQRIAGMVHYPIEEIIVITFLAVLGGAENWDDMELFGRSYQKWLKKFLKLENGIPSHDTFRRVFGLIQSRQLEAATVAFIADIIGRLRKVLKLNSGEIRHICVDGKESRATGRKHETAEEIRNLQTLHVYDNTHGVCLYSKIIEDKTNEIPVAQSILSSMELKNSIVSFDAMNTQKRTIAIIREQKGDYVGAVKANQAHMDEEVRAYFTEEIRAKIRTKGEDYYKTTEKAHNQVETREFFLTRKVQWFEDLDQWQGLKSFICYKKTMVHLVTGKETLEERYYISSVTDVVLCADAIRGHWGIENRLHWHLDASFREDGNTTVDKQAFNNLSVINKMTLSMLQLCKPLFRHNSIRSMRKQFGWTMSECLAKVLNVFSNDELLQSITITKS